MTELIVTTYFANGDELTVWHLKPKFQLTQDEVNALRNIPGVVRVRAFRKWVRV